MWANLYTTMRTLPQFVCAMQLLIRPSSISSLNPFSSSLLFTSLSPSFSSSPCFQLPSSLFLLLPSSLHSSLPPLPAFSGNPVHQVVWDGRRLQCSGDGTPRSQSGGPLQLLQSEVLSQNSLTARRPAGTYVMLFLVRPQLQ